VEDADMPGRPGLFYRAFVSYSHEDAAVATAATRALKRIAVPWYRPARRIFRDDEELPPGEPLPVLIKRALHRSAFLVVIASPHAAASSWVNREVEWWLEEAGRGPSSVIFILAEGDLAQGVPPAAAEWAAAEPLAVDLRRLAESQTFSLRSRPFVAEMAGAVARLEEPKTKQQIINAQRGQRRHALQALALASTLLCGLIALSLVLGLTARSEGALVNSQSSALSAGQKALNARQRAILAATLSAKAAQVRDSDPQTAIKLDLAALAIDGTPAIRDSLVTTLTSDHFTGLAEAGSGGIEATAESRDGRRLLTAGRDGTVRLWNIADRTDPAEVATIYSGLADSTNAVAFGPGHTVLVAAGDDVRVIDTTDPAHPRLLAHLRHASGDLTDVAAIGISPDGTTAITASLGSEISVWSIGGGSGVRLIGRVGSAVDIHAMAVAHNMRMLAVGSLLDGSAELFDLRDLAHPRGITWPAHSKPVDSLAFSPDGRYLATGGVDGQLKIWELRGTVPPAMLYHRTLPGPVGTIAFSPDGTSLAVGTGDGIVRIFGLSDIRQLVVRAVLPGHTDAVSAAVFSPDGRTLVTAGEDGRLLTWELDTLPAPSQLSMLELPGDEVFADAFSPHGGILAAGGVDGTVSTWDVKDPQLPVPRAELPGTGMVSAMAVSPSGQLLAVGSGKNILIFAMTAAGGYQLEERFPADRGLVDHLSFGATDQYLFSSGNNGQVQVSALRPHRPPEFTRPFLSGAELLGVSSTHVLAAVTGSRELSLWDVTDPARPRFLKAAPTPHTDIIEAGSFSSDGHVLATAGRDRQTVLWNMSDPRRPRLLSAPLTRQNGDIDAVAFSPDGHLLATGSYDKTTVLWNVTVPSQPSPVAVLTGQSDWVAAVAFDTHGHLATASWDGTIILWDTAPLDQAITSPVSQACAIVGTGLSRRQWAQYTNGYPYRTTCKPPASRQRSPSTATR
jgi:WD40 repeat protein